MSDYTWYKIGVDGVSSFWKLRGSGSMDGTKPEVQCWRKSAGGWMLWVYGTYHDCATEEEAKALGIAIARLKA